MALLFAASEAESFTVTNPSSMATSTDASEIDTNFARAGIVVIDDGAIDHLFASTQADFWVSFNIYFRTLNSNVNAQPFRIRDESSGQTFLRLDFVDGALNLEYWNGSSQTVIDSVGVAEDTLHRIDIRCKVDNVSGEFSCYLDGNLEAQLTGDTLHTGFTSAGSFGFRAPNVSLGPTYGSVVSEVICSTSDTRGLRLATVYPDGNGANTDWVGDYTDVDEPGLNSDGDSITSGSADEVETFTLSALSATASAYIPQDVVVGFRGQNAASGPQNIQAAVRTGGTDYFGSSVSGLTTSLNPFQTIFATNPDTAGAWTVSEINALEAGVKSIT